MWRDVLWYAYDTAVDNAHVVLPRDLSPASLIPFALSALAIYATLLSFLSTARFALRTSWLLLKWGTLLSSLVACVGLWNDDPTTKRALSAGVSGATSLASLAYSYAAGTTTGQTATRRTGSTNNAAARRRKGGYAERRNKKQKRASPYTFSDPLLGSTTQGDREGGEEDLTRTVKSFIDKALGAYYQADGAPPRPGGRTGSRRRDESASTATVDWSGVAWSAFRGDWRGVYDRFTAEGAPARARPRNR